MTKGENMTFAKKMGVGKIAASAAAGGLTLFAALFRPRRQCLHLVG